MPENMRLFNFSEIETSEKQSKEEKKFSADDYGSKNAEFIPGGFDFDYEDGFRRDEILSRSFDEATKIVEEAHDEAKKIRTLAETEGHKEGYEKGYSDGLEKARPVTESFTTAIEEITRVRSEYYAQAEKEMIDLVISIANIVIGLEVDKDPSLARNVVLKAIDELRAKEEMTIRINPEDIAEAQKVIPELSDKVEDIEKVSFKADPLIARGGCLVETNIGMIDARLEIQLESLRKRLRQTLDESQAQKIAKREDD
ncbi:hypothetical protein MNBD_NITROSPINAE04-1773 [hydrothermal vent metagenome]|uniref:Flagellar assembly protein FliH/Type III secretion system HrpE domain-containing protein n=1 Tax=hydrothermal vent metagenome TaxID=652676 RepID=A0A3B1BZA7_9ZZZZ